MYPKILDSDWLIRNSAKVVALNIDIYSNDLVERHHFLLPGPVSQHNTPGSLDFDWLIQNSAKVMALNIDIYSNDLVERHHFFAFRGLCRSTTPGDPGNPQT